MWLYRPTAIMQMSIICWIICVIRVNRSEEHTSELQSQSNLVCRLLLEKKKKNVLQLNIPLTQQALSRNHLYIQCYSLLRAVELYLSPRPTHIYTYSTELTRSTAVELYV